MDNSDTIARFLPFGPSTWAGYNSAINQAQEIWLNSQWVEDEQERSRAIMQVMTSVHVAFNIGISPRQTFPYFDKHPFHHPIAYTWGLCCPDFHYRHAYIDGARSYRIKGVRGTKRWDEFHLMAEFWGDPDFMQLGAWDLDDFDVAADDTFEIILSATAHPGNWIKLDTTVSNYMIVVRDAICDWSNDTASQLEIEPIDSGPSDIGYIGEADLYRRIGKASNFIVTSARHWVARSQEIVDEVGFNNFWQKREDNIGGIQNAEYHFMVFSIEPGEALVIAVEAPREAKFWAIQLADLCQQTLDYMNHQSSLNMLQAQVDPDGKARFVLSLEDPGVANWLDTAGNKRGIAAWRWVRTDIVPVSSVVKVPLADVGQHLHPATPTVDNGQREAVIAGRRAGIRRLYGL